MDGFVLENILTFQGLAWNSRVMKTKGSCYICIPKPLVVGNFLHKGDLLQQFAVKIDDKVALITILDKDNLNEIKTLKIEKNVSIIRNIN